MRFRFEPRNVKVNPATAFDPTVFFPLVATHDFVGLVDHGIGVQGDALLRTKDFEHLDVLRSALAASGVRSPRLRGNRQLHDYAITTLLPADKGAIARKQGCSRKNEVGILNVLEVRAVEARAGEARAVEARAGEVRAGEARAGEVRAGEVRAGEVRAGEVRAGEVRGGEGRAGEVRAGEARAGEARAGEVRAGEVRAGEVRAGFDRRLNRKPERVGLDREQHAASHRRLDFKLHLLTLSPNFPQPLNSPVLLDRKSGCSPCNVRVTLLANSNEKNFRCAGEAQCQPGGPSPCV